jgi:hypothetical protein
MPYSGGGVGKQVIPGGSGGTGLGVGAGVGVGTAVGAGVGVVVGESEPPHPTRPARTAVDARITKTARFDTMKLLNSKDASLAGRQDEAKA